MKKTLAMKERRPMENNICLWDYVLYIVLCTKLLFQETFTPLVILGSESLKLAGTDTGNYNFIHAASFIRADRDLFLPLLCFCTLSYIISRGINTGFFPIFGTIGKMSE